MSDPFQVTVDAAVRLGENPDPENRVTLKVSPAGAGARLKSLDLTVPWGTGDPALVVDKAAAQAAKPELNQAYREVEVDIGSEQADSFTWRISQGRRSFELDQGPLEITLSGFVSAAGTAARLSAKINGKASGGDWQDIGPLELPVPKTSHAPDKLEIIYFTIDKHHLSGAGQEVEVKWSVSDRSTTVELLKNDAPYRGLELTPSLRVPHLLEGSLMEHPAAAETRYSLRATDKDKKTITSRPVTVQVLQPGWYRFHYTSPFDKPLAFFKAEEEEKYETLYAIFRTAGSGTPRLYSSEQLDVWRLEAGSIPEGMETSPAVRSGDNKLWLMGGSCAELNFFSRRIFYYDLTVAREERQWFCADCHKPHEKCKGKQTGCPGPGRRWSARMGHACVVFGGDLWVLGGFDETTFGSLRDVWQRTGEEWKKLDDAPWSQRCMMAAAVYDGELHVLGGVPNPGAVRNARLDHHVLRTSPTLEWRKLKTEENDEKWDMPVSCAMAPFQGELYFCLTYLRGSLQKRGLFAWNKWGEGMLTEITGVGPWEEVGYRPYHLSAVTTGQGLLYVKALADSGAKPTTTAVHVYKPVKQV